MTLPKRASTGGLDGLCQSFGGDGQSTRGEIRREEASPRIEGLDGGGETLLAVPGKGLLEEAFDSGGPLLAGDFTQGWCSAIELHRQEDGRRRPFEGKATRERMKRHGRQ